MAVSIKEALGHIAITRAELAAVGSTLEATEAISRWVLSDDNHDAYEAHHTIALMVTMLRDMFNGKISVEDVEVELKALVSTLTGVDGVDGRFDRSEL